ncbi:MAG: CopD family protein [Paracoccus sp. (in: a-proteobacteria)]|nr:CopD family protein [Paracoccus sp. (in: a-proteobacteria)]
MIALVKFIHLAALFCWCAGLVALPVALMRYRLHRGSDLRYRDFRLITHYGYIGFATPAAVLAIAAGTWLILAADVTAHWLMVKLALVSGMVLVHAWLGHLIQESRDGQGARYSLFAVAGPALAGAGFMLAVLWLVLAKPDLAGLADLLPEMARAPMGQDLPEVLP